MLFQFKDLGPIIILLMTGLSIATSTDVNNSGEEGSRQGKVCKCGFSLGWTWSERIKTKF